MSHRILSGHVVAMLWCIVAAKGDLFGRSENVPVLGFISERRYAEMRDLRDDSRAVARRAFARSQIPSWSEPSVFSNS